MPASPEVAGLIKHVEQLLRNGQFGDSRVKQSASVGDPIPVLDLENKLYAWFVPVTIDKRIVSFFMFSPDSTLQRYSSFQRQEGQLDSCPLATSWIDEKTILRRAGKEMLKGEQAGRLYLSFDGSPSRIAWRVDTELPDGGSRAIYIAGDSVWSVS